MVRNESIEGIVSVLSRSHDRLDRLSVTYRMTLIAGRLSRKVVEDRVNKRGGREHGENLIEVALGRIYISLRLKKRGSVTALVEETKGSRYL